MSDDTRSNRGRNIATDTYHLVGVSFVRAPKCEACGREMVVYSSTHWWCLNVEKNCSALHTPVHVGVYGPSEVSDE